jgi:hypothetical protein
MKSESISSSEWRWVGGISSLLVTLTLLPYAWALIASANSTVQFMGILSNPQDGATYLSKIQQGVDGHWLFELRHTPQPHDPAGFHLFYLLLGHVASLLGVSPVLIFHVARVAASFFMFFALYHLAASIWQRPRPRRLFFLLTAIGSGLGWLALILVSNEEFAPDLYVPEAFPLFAAYTNPHFPLAIGCIALLAAQIMEAFRPGMDEAPNPENGGLLVVVLSVILAIISPPAILVVGSVLAVYTLVQAISTRSLPIHQARWTAVIALPAFPFAVYYYAVFRFNDTFGQFNEQNVTDSPNVVLFLFGFGLLLLMALPGIWRAAKRFEPDGDQLMLIWLGVNTLLVYLPFFALQRRLFIGLIIPVVYFAVRALEDYWFTRIPEKWRAASLVALVVFILPSHVLTFIAPLAFAVFDRQAGQDTSLLLSQDYIQALEWADNDSQNNQVLLASPPISLWIPARTHLRPFYGHPFETVPAELRRQAMRHFYQGEDCQAVFDSALPFRVSYVLWGPQEDKIGIINPDDQDIDEVLSNVELENIEALEGQRLPNADACKTAIAEAASQTQQFGSVTLYILAEP